MPTIKTPHRVFILGAGASFFAGFPLGRRLLPFLVDHTSVTEGVGSLEWVITYLLSLPEPERTRMMEDLELFLTRIELGDSRRTLKRDLNTTELDAAYQWVTAMQTHLLANRANLRGDPEGTCKRAIEQWHSGIMKWYGLDDFVRTVVQGMISHHMCLLHGRKHFRGGPYPGEEVPASRFFEALSEERGTCPCAKHHTFNRLRKTIDAIANKMRAGDTIITFNWDVLWETILLRAGKWNLSDGYGIPVQTHKMWLSSLSRAERRRHLAPSPIKILKAHGSINWITYVEDTPDGQKPRFGVRYLRLLFDLPMPSTYPERSYDPEMDTPDPLGAARVVLSPTYTKAYSGLPLAPVWDQIVSAIAAADEITVIGYSLPRGDAAAWSLLNYALRRNEGCKMLGIVTPGSMHDSNWPEFAWSVGKNARCIFSSLEEWASSPA